MRVCVCVGGWGLGGNAFQLPHPPQKANGRKLCLALGPILSPFVSKDSKRRRQKSVNTKQQALDTSELVGWLVLSAQSTTKNYIRAEGNSH